MRRIEPHKHTFSFPVAEKEDLEAGISNELIVTPAVLGSAAICDKEEFASAEHGGKVDEIYENAKSIDQIKADLARTEQKAKEAAEKAEQATQAAETASLASLNTSDHLEEIRLVADKAKQSVESLGELAKKDQVSLEDLSIPGDRDAEHVLSGTGWVEWNLGKADREKIEKIEELAAEVDRLKDCCSKPQNAAVSIDITDRVDEASNTALEAKAKSDQAFALATRVEQEVKQCCDDANAKADLAQKKADSSEAKANTVEATVTRHGNEIETLKKQTEDAKTRAIAADAKISALEAVSVDNEQARNAVKTIEGKLTAAEASADRSKNLSEQASAQVAQLNNRIDGFEPRISSATTACENAKAKSELAETKSISAEVTAKSAEEKAKSAVDQLGVIQRCCEDNKGKITQVETDIQTLRGQVQSSGEKADNALNTVNALEAKVAEVKRCCEAAGGGVAGGVSAEELAGVKTTAEAARDKISEVEGKLTTAEGKLTTAEGKVTTVEGKLTTVEGKVTEAEGKITAAEGKIAAAEGKITAAEGKIAASEGKIAASEGKITALEGKVDALEKRPAGGGGGDVDFYTSGEMADQAKFEKLIDESHKRVADLATQVGIKKHVTPGMDEEERWVAVSGYKNKPNAWLKDLKEVAVHVMDSEVHSLYHQARLSYLEDVINMADVTMLSRHKPFLQPQWGKIPAQRRRLTLKAGTVISFDLNEKKGHIVFNKDHEISHGVGGGQHDLKPGTDYYVFALIDWDSESREVTFSIQESTTPPAGYNKTNSMIIGGFHTLCVDVGGIADHKLTGFQAGDILPNSVWCLNHRPKCSPSGMVYHPDGHFWVDIYLMSVAGNQSRSRYNAAILRRGREFSYVRLMAAGKKFMDNMQFVAAVNGTPAGCRVATALTNAGGHKGSNGKRIISHIGVEDGFGVYSQYLSDLHAKFTSNLARVDIRAIVAGGSYAQSMAGLGFFTGDQSMTEISTVIAARGVCESR